jgi:hypothetical protein
MSVAVEGRRRLRNTERVSHCAIMATACAERSFRLRWEYRLATRLLRPVGRRSTTYTDVLRAGLGGEEGAEAVGLEPAT